MSREYLNGRWCVRCGKCDPTPYLKKNTKLFPTSGLVLDIGCGNGRNSTYMRELGYEVDSLDMAGDFGIQMVLGVDPFPEKKYDVILANYILMFLNKDERKKVFEQILECSKKDTVLMVEMYPAKDAYDYILEEIVAYFEFHGWKKLRRSKERFIMEKL